MIPEFTTDRMFICVTTPAGRMTIPVERWPLEAEALGLGHYDEDGFVPDQPAAPKPLVPERVTNAQARAALRSAGLIDKVEAAIAASGTAAIADAWEYSPEISRQSALVKTLGHALGLSDEQIDALFVQAAAVVF